MDHGGTGEPSFVFPVGTGSAVFTLATSAEEAGDQGHVLPLDVVPQSGNRTAIIGGFRLASSAQLPRSIIR